jgi:hypothetical protein
MRNGRLISALASAIALILTCWTLSGVALADNAAELAKKIQDPLTDLAALQVDFHAKFNVGENDKTSYSAIFQPLYTIDAGKYNLVTRQLIPVLGVPTVTNIESDHNWGLGDIVSSVFISPKSESDLKWGVGPQLSFETRSKDELGGAGWGGGVTSVLVGASGPWSFATFLSHLWGFEDDYSTTTFQPLVFYNIEAMPGLMVSYQGEVTYNWKADNDDRLNLPLGLQIGKMFDLGAGWGFQLDVGAYGVPVRAKGAADWEFKTTMFLVFP